jgi:hypothetical protein
VSKEGREKVYMWVVIVLFAACYALAMIGDGKWGG